MKIAHSNMRNFTAPYTFVEYPKWVKLADGTDLLVHDADEEAAAIGPAEAAPEDGTDDGIETDERAALFAKAKAMGLTPHQRHGVAKLREMIAAAKAPE